MPIPVGTAAFYEATTKTVTCDECVSAETPLVDPPQGVDAPKSSLASAPEDLDLAVQEIGSEPSSVGGRAPAIPAKEVPVAAVIGTAGASARGEHALRHQRRKERIRTAHPRIGGLILALSEDPQSTRAWETGAGGEERLAARLDADAGDTLRLLHDRRIPGTRANIDHIAITPSGVFVIDAKRYKGRPHLRVEGGLLRSRVEKVMVGTRDGTKLVDGVLRQVEIVQSMLLAEHPLIPVHGVLCFLDADWPLIGGDFTARGVYVVWPKKLQKHLQRSGEISPGELTASHQLLAERLPPA